MTNKYDHYYDHLNKISTIGWLYKRFFLAPLLYVCTIKFGKRIVEVGSGIGSGLLGSFPKRVTGLEINPQAVALCQSKGLNVQLIYDAEPYPMASNTADVCVLDNVLEHLVKPSFTLAECSRICKKNGGLVIAVPGLKGYASDDDHKIFYDENNLTHIHPDWALEYSFSTPFFFKSKWLSERIKQYCVVAVYKKI